MKNKVLILLLLIISPAISAQNRATEILISGYEGKTGYSVVYISGKMLSMFSEANKNKTIPKLESITILSSDSLSSGRKLSIRAQLAQIKGYSDFEEIMEIRESGSSSIFLVLRSGSRIKELVMITSSASNETLVSIKGDFTLSDISGLTENTGLNGLEKLKDADKIHN